MRPGESGGMETIMGMRKNESLGFVDAMMVELGGPRSGALLERLDVATPWEKLAAPILKLPEYRGTGAGRPAWSPVLMLKCLMLAKWNNLSDPGLEEALKDRISFRKFVGLSFTDTTPDETTFVKFRARLREAGLHDVIFDAVVKHIERQGLLVKEGTMVDATIIEAPRGRPRPDGTTTRDQDASFTSKHGVPHHGYKGHIAADLSGIVTDYRFGTAKEHDSNYIDELTDREAKLVLADSAYSDRARREALRSRGVIDGICYKRNRGQKKLYDWQERWNRLVSKGRARVEHPTAMLKQQLGYRRVRYRGRERNALDFALTLTACNIKRSLSLRAA
ncbi:MAG: IS5 family transposase [Phycisphaeraceae bacterium]|nr:IS5 family transposase [Phycisphaeraceae bacterium]MBX3377845.1 IS5 family transposase [Phycisphaeraceae bacterium]MBX3378039.1 IS5 family transposase [Phycisphaeraceae bacterium]